MTATNAGASIWDYSRLSIAVRFFVGCTGKAMPREEPYGVHHEYAPYEIADLVERVFAMGLATTFEEVEGLSIRTLEIMVKVRQ